MRGLRICSEFHRTENFQPTLHFFIIHGGVTLPALVNHFPQLYTKGISNNPLTMETFEEQLRKAIEQGVIVNAVLEARRSGMPSRSFSPSFQ